MGCDRWQLVEEEVGAAVVEQVGLVYHGAPWCTMVHHGVLWFFAMHGMV